MLANIHIIIIIIIITIIIIIIIIIIIVIVIIPYTAGLWWPGKVNKWIWLNDAMINTHREIMAIIFFFFFYFYHFVIKTNGMRKRRFDRSTVIIKQSEDKNFHKY